MTPFSLSLCRSNLSPNLAVHTIKTYPLSTFHSLVFNSYSEPLLFQQFLIQLPPNRSFCTQHPEGDFENEVRSRHCPRPLMASPLTRNRICSHHLWLQAPHDPFTCLGLHDLLSYPLPSAPSFPVSLQFLALQICCHFRALPSLFPLPAISIWFTPLLPSVFAQMAPYHRGLP